MRSGWRRLFGAAAAALLLASGPAAGAAGPGGPAGGAGLITLQDMADYTWASPGIYAVMAQGWMLGVGPGRFGPNLVMTRAQAAVVFGRAAGWQPGPMAGMPFADAGSTPAWAQGYLGLAYHVGWMRGVSADRIAPNEPLTWPALAVMAARALSLPAVPAAQVPILLAKVPNGPATPAWAQQAVAQLVQARILVGPLAAMYQPDGTVTRAAMAMFMYEVQEVLPNELPGMAGSQLITGTLVSLSAAAPGSPASITVKTSATTTQTLQLSANVVVLVNGTPASLSYLQAGMAVSLLIGGGPTQRVVLIVVG